MNINKVSTKTTLAPQVSPLKPFTVLPKKLIISQQKINPNINTIDSFNKISLKQIIKIIKVIKIIQKDTFDSLKNPLQCFL